MVLTAYFDESGTHAGSEVTAMAGFVGDARQWRKFEKRVSKLFRRFNVDVFHTIDVRRTDKDFEGWKVDRKLEFLDEFQHIINETLESGVSAFIRSDDYKYYCDLGWPKKTAGFQVRHFVSRLSFPDRRYRRAYSTCQRTASADRSRGWP